MIASPVLTGATLHGECCYLRSRLSNRCLSLAYLSFSFAILPLLRQFKSMAWPWMFTCGFSFSFAALFSKIWRINKIFHNPQFRRITVKLVDPLMWMREEKKRESFLRQMCSLQEQHCQHCFHLGPRRDQLPCPSTRQFPGVSRPQDRRRVQRVEVHRCFAGIDTSACHHNASAVISHTGQSPREVLSVLVRRVHCCHVPTTAHIRP
mmetsp:Transcript_1460/g.4071  ORF Transcript_1460/g.4071 Transcript_1460/m.4071 type:complete len:207 (+) Transcript_1460:1063-1683(+)